MWQYGLNYNGTAYIFKPIWWTMAYFGNNQTIPTFGSDGTISCGNHEWKWKPTSGQGPFTLTIDSTGNIIVSDVTGTPVTMSPAWPTPGYYNKVW
jgi:hypothetical protein